MTEAVLRGAAVTHIPVDCDHIPPLALHVDGRVGVNIGFFGKRFGLGDRDGPTSAI